MLEEADFKCNQLQKLEVTLISGAKSLVILDLSLNQLSSLPSGLSQCKTLRFIDVKGNPLVGIPPQALESSSILLQHLRTAQPSLDKTPKIEKAQIIRHASLIDEKELADSKKPGKKMMQMSTESVKGFFIFQIP